jgi:hypothetical protein
MPSPFEEKRPRLTDDSALEIDIANLQNVKSRWNAMPGCLVSARQTARRGEAT